MININKIESLEAFEFEQSLHLVLKTYLIENEREIYNISETDIDKKWYESIGNP